MTQPHSSAPARFMVCTIALENRAVANVLDGCSEAPDTEFAGEFSEYLAPGRRPQFSQRVKDSGACIILIDFDRDPEKAAESAKLVHQTLAGKVATIAVSNREDAELLLAAMRAGCCEFLPTAFDQEQFTGTIARLESRFVIASTDTPKHAGHVLSFFGVKGGVGTTTLAVYLSTFLVRQHRKKVLLIDHHHQLGHVSLYLGVKENPYYFDELLRNVDRLDLELLTGFLSHHPSGLDLLPSPDTCAARYSGSPHDMEQVLEFLRGEYDYVVLDSSLEYQDVNSALVDRSDEVYLVATPDVAALRDLSRHVENFGLDATATHKVRVALNRASSHDAVNKEQVESAVRFPVSVTIPNNYVELVRAVNAGEPLSPQRRSEFTGQIGKWTNRVVQAHSSPVAEAPKRKSFAFWR